MDIILLVIGKIGKDYLREGIGEYVGRLRRYVPFELKVLPDIKAAGKLTEQQQKDAEGEVILNWLQISDCVILLDEKGREFTSEEFADFLSRKMGSGLKRLCFVVGGPYGFAKSVYNRADGKLSLSKMTFSHEMVRLFFTEQIYRAMTILRGEPYHHR